MRVVILGAGGQLGRELCSQFGDEAIGLDHWTVDLSRTLTMRSAIARCEPDAVINAAAFTDVDRAESESDECRAVNVTGCEALAEICAERDCPLVQISSDYVFGDHTLSRPLRETDPTSPQGVYALSKRDGELAVARHRKHLIVRTCGLYSRPDSGRRSFVRTMLRLAAGKTQIRVVNDQHCTPSYVPHVARAIRFLLTEALLRDADALWGTYHITNQGATTWYDFARELFRRAKLSTEIQPISTGQFGAVAPRPPYSVLDTEKYHRLGGPAMPTWQEALAEYIEQLPAPHATTPGERTDADHSDEQRSRVHWQRVREKDRHEAK